MNYVAHYTPTIWQRLGFGGCSSPNLDDVDDDYAPGAIGIVTTVRFDWLDRLRILVSGNVMVNTRCRTDVIVERSMSRSAVSVLPPGDCR